MRRIVAHRWLPACALVLGAAVLAACGGGGEGRFDDEVSAVRAAIADQDRMAAEHAIEALAIDAFAAVDDGDIDEDALEEVAALVEASRAELDQILPTTTTTTTTTATTTAPPVFDDDDGDDDDGERRGKPGQGKGRGNDDD